jgi:hypothetical protein
LVLSRYAAVRCSGSFGFGPSVILMPNKPVKVDCPPFRLAKFLVFKGKRLRCRQSAGSPLP